MVGSCLSNMASEYFYLKSCRKHRFPEASIYSESFTLCTFQVGWILRAIMEKRNYIYTGTMLCCYDYEPPNEIILHSNQKKKKAAKNMECNLEWEWQKKSSCYFMFRKWIHQCLTLWSNINPASAISLEESDELVESKRDAK